MENTTKSLPAERSKARLLIGLLGLVKPLAFYMCLAVAAGVAGFLVAIFIPICGIYAMLAILGSGAGVSITGLVTLCVIFAVSRGFLRYAEQLCNHYIAFRVLALIRERIFACLRKLAPARLESKDKGSLISLITADVEIMEVFYAHTISPVVIGGIVSVIMTIYIASFHWVLGAVAFTAYVFVGAMLPAYVSKAGRTAGEAQRTTFAALNDYLFDTLRGMREVFQYGAHEARLEKISSLGDALTSDQRRLKKYGLHTQLLNGFALVFFPALMLICGGKLYQAGEIGLAGLIIPVVALLSSFAPVLALSGVANTLLITFAAGNRIVDLLEEQPQVNEIVHSKDVSFDGLECSNITFAYNGQDVLKDVSLRTGRNRILSISGKSGAGKSTLLRLIMRFWETGKGTISMSGVNINEVNTASLRRNESCLFQFPVLLDETIADNIRIARPGATAQELENAARKASIHEFISGLDKGYETRVGELGDRLSSGEKQRICLARLFLHDAPLILLDEPTSNVDSLNEGIILRSLKEASAEKTVVLVTHRQSTRSIADAAFNLHGNRAS